MTQIVPRHAITFVAKKGNQLIDLKFKATAPAAMSIPLAGDEVRIPDEVGTKAGFKNGIFKVVSRRFHYSDLPAGIAGAVSLVLLQEP